MALALFTVEPIGVDGQNEAVNVYHFDSDFCRQKFFNSHEDDYLFGDSPDWIDGTVCDYCGEKLTR